MARIGLSGAGGTDPQIPTLLVAADDAPQAVKDVADRVCSGAADDVDIQWALDALPATGGQVVLSSGTFVITTGITITIAYAKLTGMGFSTILEGNQDSYTIDIQADYVEISHLKIGQVAGSGSGGARPNCIEITNQDYARVINCWLVGDESVADDGSDNRQNGIYADTNSDYLWIQGCLIEDNDRNGAFTSGDFIDIRDTVVRSNGYAGIYIGASVGLVLCGCHIIQNGATGSSNGLRTNNTDYSTIADNYFYQNDYINLELFNVDHAAVIGNVVVDSQTWDGIHANQCNRTLISGNVCDLNQREGIDMSLGAADCTVSSNICCDNGRAGIWLDRPSRIDVIGNILRDNSGDGIEINNASNNFIIGNFCYSNNVNGIEMTNNADNNVVQSNYTNGNATSIEIDAGCDNNRVLYNTVDEGSITDNGINTRLPSRTYSFVEGTTLLSADAGAKGWEIDAGGEFALALGHLPLEVQSVVRIKVWAVGLVAPGVGNNMRVEISINAAQDDEAYTTEAISVINKPNTTANFAVDDVIHWVIDSTDDVDIADLVGGDSFEVKIEHEGAGNGDIETDAVFRCVEFEYV